MSLEEGRFAATVPAAYTDSPFPLQYFFAVTPERQRRHDRPAWHPTCATSHTLSCGRLERRAAARSARPHAHGVIGMSPSFFADLAPSGLPARTARTRTPSSGTTRTGSCSASGWKTICASPSLIGTACAGRAPTRSAATRSAGPGWRAATPWTARGRRRMSRSSCFACWTCRISASTTATSRPEGGSLAETNRNTREMAALLGRKMEGAKVRLLWGTANLFSHRRFMAGAATNPDPDVFRWCASQVRTALEVTHELGGENYVLWGGREGYETLLNTDLKREADQLGRFLNLVVEHKHRIGFTGTILIEPKPQEPTKHQYDHDVATVWGFLQQYGLEREVKVNIEANHATLGGAFVRARDRAGRVAGDPGLDRHEQGRRAIRLGHRPVPDQRRGHGAGDVLHPEGGRAGHGRARTSTPRCDANRSTRSTWWPRMPGRWTSAPGRCWSRRSCWKRRR